MNTEKIDKLIHSYEHSYTKRRRLLLRKIDDFKIVLDNMEEKILNTDKNILKDTKDLYDIISDLVYEVFALEKWRSDAKLIKHVKKTLLDGE